VLDLSPEDAKLLQSLLPPSLVQALEQSSPSSGAIVDGCAKLERIISELAAFVPSTVLDKHLERPGSERIGAHFISGSALMVDFSGFTALSSQFASMGREGNEEISAVLNRVFAMLIEEIYACGGGIIRFGGDSLTAFFDARLGGGSAALACTAALAMQARISEVGEVSTSNGSFGLRLRIAVHSGRLFAVEVGDRSHMELILTGHTVARLVVAQQSAAPGEIIVTDEVLQGLDSPRAQQKLTGLYRLHGFLQAARCQSIMTAKTYSSHPSPDALARLLHRISSLHPYLPYGLPHRFIQSGNAIGEFRPITVLFANFYPFSRILTLLELPAVLENDMEMIGRLLNTYYTRIQTVIHYYGGSINKVDMAAFGDRLMILFGAPTAHEDDPAHAVQAALQVRTALGDVSQELSALLHAWVENHLDQRALLQVISFGLRARIGIASGALFAGIVGTSRRREYTVIGPTVRLAARLMAGSDGDILLTSMTYRAARRVVDVKPVPPVQLPDFVQAVPVFRVQPVSQNTRHRQSWQPNFLPLVGRQLELRQIVDLAKGALAVDSTAGHVVEVVGEPGIGKSRLASEALANLQMKVPTALVVHDTCPSYEQNTPYASFARLLRQLLLLSPGDARSAQALTVQQYFDQWLPAWRALAPLLGSILNVPLPDTDLTRSLALEQQRGQLHDLLIMLCLAAAKRTPLVIAIDDLQWADAASLALVQRLTDQLPNHRLFLMLISRQAPDLNRSGHLLRHSTTIALRELPQEDSEALLTILLEGPVPAELLPLIERAQSTPFFLEETVRYLRDSGVLKRTNTGEWVCAGTIDGIIIPSEIEQLIVARIDRLTEPARALLQIGAVLGQTFSERLLMSLSTASELAARALAELVQAALVLPDETAPEPTFHFKHAMIRDVAYSGMLFAQRQKLHHEAALAIEQLHASELDDYRSLVTQHYLRAGAADDAFPHILILAHQAQLRYAPAEALDLYNQALAVAPWRDQCDELPDIVSAVDLHENMGDLMALLDSYAGAREHYMQGIKLIERSRVADRLIRVALLQRKVGIAYEHEGDIGLALKWFERAKDAITSAVPSDTMRLEHTRILNDLGWVHFRRGDLAQAEELLKQALAHISRNMAFDEQARIHNRLGGIAYSRGDLALACHYVEQSLAASEQSGNLPAQADALNNLGILAESQGRIEASIRSSLQAMQINERIGSRRGLAINAINVGWAYYSGEEYERARLYFSEALEHATAVGDTYHQMVALLDLGRVLTALEQWDEAEPVIRQSLALALQLNTPWVLDCRVALAELALERGNTDAALDEYQYARSLEIDRETEEYGRFQRLEAKIALVQGERDTAIQILHANQALFARLQNASEQKRTGKLLASMVVLTHRTV
jgi:predicted ATPase/class 3 adenylate cyclase